MKKWIINIISNNNNKSVFCMAVIAIVLCVTTDNEFFKNVSYSIVAATIFYIIVEYIPELKRENRRKQEELYLKAIAYRKLQLCLTRVDSIFTDMYRELNEIKNFQEVEMSLEEFYDIEHIMNIVDNIDINTSAPVISRFNKDISYKEYLRLTWNEAVQYANEALGTRYVEMNAVLAYELQYLISEGTLPVFFKMLDVRDISTKDIFPKGTNNERYEGDTLRNIIQLHKIAFSLYNELKVDKSFKAIYKPCFYQ